VMQADALIVGGGIAGLQAAIQLGRYRHRVAVVDRGYGRSTLCRRYNNVLGWPDGVSGMELREKGRKQAESFGVVWIDDEITGLAKTEDGFTAFGRRGAYAGRVMLLATGVIDRFPDVPGLKACLGTSVYVCPDCDGYETSGRKTVVLGSGNSGARMALELLYWTDDITYVNHGGKPIDPSLAERLAEHRVDVVNGTLEAVEHDEGRFRTARLAEGGAVAGERAFIAFGGNEVNTALAASVGAERLENRHIVTDPRTKMTTVPGLWAAGDVGVHSEQLTVAMGEGALAAVWMHKELLRQGIAARPEAPAINRSTR